MENEFVLQNIKVIVMLYFILLFNELEYGLYCIKFMFILVNVYSIKGIVEGYVKVIIFDLIIDMQEGFVNERMYL